MKMLFFKFHINRIANDEVDFFSRRDGWDRGPYFQFFSYLLFVNIKMLPFDISAILY